MHIGITAPNGAGKDTVALFFKQKGLALYSLSDALRNICIEQNIPITRDNLIRLAESLKAQQGHDVLAQKALAYTKQPTVFVSIRHLAELQTLKKHGVVIIGIVADQKTRYERNRIRNRYDDNYTYEEFLHQEQRERSGKQAHHNNIDACMALADIHIDNNGTLDALYAQLEHIIQHHKLLSIHFKNQ
ncbi:MAG: hypothetical protein ACMXYC_03420 [Candidatus Woesearchaeota archaeon]